MKRIELSTAFESFTWNFLGKSWTFLGIHMSTVSRGFFPTAMNLGRGCSS